MKAFILALATAVPAVRLKQPDIASFMIDSVATTTAQALFIRSLYERTAIEERYSVIEDFNNTKEKWVFWGPLFPYQQPGTKIRNELYKKKALELAHAAATRALDQWGGSPEQISHVISVSCTGVMAPGIEFHLLHSLNLKSTTARLGINFMGCFGGFAALKVARALAHENPDNRILIVCTELCSLHFQTDSSTDTLIANALFSDGAAAVVVGGDYKTTEQPLWEIITTRSAALPNSLDEMSWDAGDTGFIMKLSNKIPPIIKQHIGSFTTSLLETIDQDACLWAIHPGGKTIIQAIEQACHLNQTQTKASRSTLKHYGNMSSPSIFFVLDASRKKQSQYQWTLGLGFGPGLSMEGILLKNIGNNNDATTQTTTRTSI